MSNYTTGPWQLQNTEGLLSVQVVKQPDKCICTVYKLFFEDAEALANARLMAAAPDLLEALEATIYVLELHHYADCKCSVCKNAKAAITKAK